jgi:hypothetical protein
MKRMSEVFELPVKVTQMDHEHAGEITQSGESHFCLEDGGYWMASNIEHIEAAAHAINHADQLADALQNLLDAVGRQSHTLSAEDFLAVDAGLLALHNYRGEK